MVITWHLFETYRDVDPGELTDLRSVSVSNENFARCAVKHKLQQHLQHASALLLEQITEFVMQFEEAREEDLPLLNGSKCPKVTPRTLNFNLYMFYKDFCLSYLHRLLVK